MDENEHALPVFGFISEKTESNEKLDESRSLHSRSTIGSISRWGINPVIPRHLWATCSRAFRHGLAVRFSSDVTRSRDDSKYLDKIPQLKSKIFP